MELIGLRVLVRQGSLSFPELMSGKSGRVCQAEAETEHQAADESETAF
jgi:hypothetical protein